MFQASRNSFSTAKNIPLYVVQTPIKFYIKEHIYRLIYILLL